MENEQMNPSYDQLAQAYNQLVHENQQLKIELDSIRSDKTIERLTSLVDIITKFNNSSDKALVKIVKNAKWHLNQILAKPKK